MAWLGGRGSRRARVWGGAAVLGLVGAGLVVGWFWPFEVFMPGDFTRVPLWRSRFLRGVTEPVVMLRAEAEAGSDDHWMSLTFRDARGVERTARFVYYIAGAEGSPGLYRTLVLGKAVPAGGREERAFLGLLQRWYRGDPDARASYERTRRRGRSEPRGPVATPDPKAAAVVLMNVLRKRN